MAPFPVSFKLGIDIFYGKVIPLLHSFDHEEAIGRQTQRNSPRWTGCPSGGLRIELRRDAPFLGRAASRAAKLDGGESPDHPSSGPQNDARARFQLARGRLLRCTSS